MPRVIKPKNCANVLKLRTTIHETRDSWLHLGHNGHIYIVNQRKGQDWSGTVTLTRSEFQQFVNFWNRAQRRAK